MLLLGHAAVSARRGPRGTCQETRAALWAPAECGVTARSASDGVDVNGIRCIIDVFNTENISAECFQGLARTAFYCHVAFRHPEWTAAWLRAGAEDLNDWMPLLGAQALPVMITLELEWWLRSDVWPTGKYVPVWRRIVGCSFRLGAVWETAGRNFALLWVALSATRLNRKVCPRIYAQNGMEFPPSTCQKKSLRSCCSGGLFVN